ncbi:MAG: hypothetical protein JWM10_1605 [Myxococcaceae bacterium]|nr:hypothetical protein [Myxococcaceae bacterium]
MSPENMNPKAPSLLPYEAPRVVEDLPLETYSLACEVGGGGKNPGSCDQEPGGFANT